MEHTKVSLEDMLTAKEQRKMRQDTIRQRFNMPIVSITLNMPGPVKDTPLLRQLCDYAVSAVKSRLIVASLEQVNLVTGPEALLAIPGDAQAIKAACAVIEEEYAFARLLDIDVFAADGRQISRQQQGRLRQCLICSQPAVVCMREGKHSLAEVLVGVQRLMAEFCAYQTRQVSPLAEKLGALAVEAMLYEVACTPAPGLVDRDNAGAHRDMDFYTFMASSAALSLVLARCAEAGCRHEGELSALMPVLRAIGIEGEQTMLAATAGVNTHKGLLFSLGIVVAAAGWVKSNRRAEATIKVVLDVVATMVDGIVERELGYIGNKSLSQMTAGERLYQIYGITGIRGEMEQGLPSVQQHSLPALRQALSAGLSINDSLVQTLLVLTTVVDDTTVMNRHNPEKMRHWAKPRVEAVLAEGGMYVGAGAKTVAALDKEFIEHNVSPGGAADLLAVTWFLHRLDSIK